MRPRKTLAALTAALSLTGCVDYGNVPEFKKLEGRKVELDDEERKVVVQRIQETLLEGNKRSAIVDQIIRTLGIDETIAFPLKKLTIQGVPVGTAEPSLLESYLKIKRDIYLGLAPTALDRYGFVPGCDGLLFTSLLRAGGFAVDLREAETPGEPGRWHRDGAHACYDKTNPNSTSISRDMMTGLLFGLWQTQDLKAAQDVLAFARANRWIIGEANNDENLYGRAYMSPGLASNYYELQFRLGGEDHPARTLPQLYDLEVKGFERHLQLLSILFRGLLRGGVTGYEAAFVQAAAVAEPQNAFFQAVLHTFLDGDMTLVALALLDTTHFPNGRLPTVAEHCEAYLWQRDASDTGWQPCPNDGKDHPTHPGADLIFVSSLALGLVRSAPVP